MNDTIKAIEVSFYDKENSLQLATDIYTTHIKPPEDALTKAEEREKVMVEALEECVPVLEAADEFFNGVSATLNQARAVLVSVKEEIPS